MVLCAVEQIGRTKPVCFARSLLFAASNSLEAGDITKAGVQLRESVNRYLVALCEAHDCTPRKKNLRTPAMMNRALLGPANHGGGVTPDDAGVRWSEPYRALLALLLDLSLTNEGFRLFDGQPVPLNLIEEAMLPFLDDFATGDDTQMAWADVANLEIVSTFGMSFGA